MKTSWTSGGNPKEVITARDPGPPPETDAELLARHEAAVQAAVAEFPIDTGTEIRTTWKLAVGRHAREDDYDGTETCANFVESHFGKVLDAWAWFPPEGE
jgi:hypothetical protein